MNNNLRLRDSVARRYCETVFMQILFLLVCFGLSPTLRGVTPTPDGGYPGGNTAEGGTGALFRLTTGSNNTALGSQALYNVTNGVQNTATGAQALKDNRASHNTADGFQALSRNSDGTENTATGWRALFQNTAGDFNTADGSGALYKNTGGSDNTAAGYQALYSNGTGSNNTAVGSAALVGNTAGDSNTAVGAGALGSNGTGSGNTATGTGALATNITGSNNTANGVGALGSGARYDVIGSNNTVIGAGALVGDHGSLIDNNTVVGAQALPLVTGGHDNIAIGYRTGANLSGGDNNIEIGNAGEFTDSNYIRIGASQIATFIAGIRGVTTGQPNAVPVLIDSAGQLGTMSSSRRFKKEIRPMDCASDPIFALKPVTFQYNSDTTNTPQFGLIAEEVARVNPDLVVRDKDGEIYTVRYDAVNAMVLNEFLKAHRKIEEQEHAIAQLTSGMETLTATVKQQATEIQQMSVQFKKSNAPMEVVANQ